MGMERLIDRGTQSAEGHAVSWTDSVLFAYFAKYGPVGL